MSRNIEQYTGKGISGNDMQTLFNLDPSRTKKYMPFIVKSYRDGATMDMLRNCISEYDTLVNRNLADRKDIGSFGDFKALEEYVQRLNNTRSHREVKRESKVEAEIIADAEACL